MSENHGREERAFEALIVDTLRKAANQDVDIASIRDPNEKEKDALQRVRGEFLERLIAGDIDTDEAEDTEENCGEDFALAGDSCGSSLYRTEGIDDELKRQLDEVDREVIERKKREREDGDAH